MQDGYMGVIQALGFQFAPENWSYCAGQLIAIAQQTALYSLLSCNFGGDCRSVFAYPDLRGRVPIGQFQGPGLTNRIIGQMPGQEYFYMSLSQMPSHTHTHTYGGSGGGGTGPKVEVCTTGGKNPSPSDGDYLAPPASPTGAITSRAFISPADIPAGGTVEIGGVMGGSGTFDNTLLAIQTAGGEDEVYITQPSVVINYCICTDGLYPARS